MKDSLAFVGTRGYSSCNFVFVMNSDRVLLHLSPPCTSQCTQEHRQGPWLRPTRSMSTTVWEKQSARRKVKQLRFAGICSSFAAPHCTSAVPSSMALHVAWPFLHGPACLSAATLQCQIPVSLTEVRAGSSNHKIMPSLYSATDKDSDPYWFLTILISVLLQVLEKPAGCSSLRVDGDTAQPNTIPGPHYKASLRSKQTAGLKI